MPLVITSLGAVPELVEAIHSYGGLVFHDVINMRHAEKAMAAGVDGIIAVCAGAGGHAGRSARSRWCRRSGDLRGHDRAVGRDVDGRARRCGEADRGGPRLYGHALHRDAGKPRAGGVQADVVGAKAADILYTPAISGVNANFMRQSIAAAGLDPDNLAHAGKMDMGEEAKVWKTIWSAGQGVGSVADVPTAAELCARLKAEYAEARRSLA